ncbi:transcriptional regulator [Oxalobacteraceae bacterium OM1]|nr:transcriptional regulator [Oxalobacteraceae bacterium OM1]
MRQTVVAFRFVVALSALVPFTLHAESGDPAVETRDAQAWLKKIQSAAQKLNYSGTFVYQQASQFRTSRITHVLDGRSEIEKLEILDGKPREYIRNNDEVICYVPEARTLLVEKRATQELFPALLGNVPADLADYYDVRKGEAARIAGQECQSLVLEPRDKLRYGYKLWADKATGLLLRAQTLNEQHEIVEQISFTQVSIGNIERSRARPSYMNTQGWHVENAVLGQTNLSGWSVKSLPPGFKKIREVKRLVSDAPAAAGGHASVVAQREVSQIVYSDGLAAISVFVEPGSQSRTEGSAQQGAMNIVGKRHGDFWLTIVGEVPAAAIRQVANSIEYRPK